MTVSPPAGGWGGYGLAKTAEQAQIEADKLKAHQDLNAARDKITFLESKLASREKELDAANLKVDTLAAKIVDLEAKIEVMEPHTFGADLGLRATIRSLQAADLVQRRNIAISENRVIQLIKAWPADSAPPPEELLHAWNRDKA
jgi:predicted nuclease with TOPRIM domain